MAMLSSNSPSRRSARTEFLVPRWSFAMVAAFRMVSGDFEFPSRVFRSKPLNSPEGGIRGWPRRPHHRAARPPPRPRRPMVWGPWAPPWPALLAPWIFRENKLFDINSGDFPESWISAQKRDTRAILLKTALVRVSCIQNTQIRGKTIAKVFGKSRYVLDVSTPPKLSLLLVLKQFS